MQSSAFKPPKNQNKTCNPKTKPLRTFLSDLHRAWTEAVKTVTKGYCDIF